MPEIFRFFGFSFFLSVVNMNQNIFILKGMMDLLSMILVGSSFQLRVMHNIKTNDQKKIEAVIEENKDVIIKRWRDYFEK